jgi:hypothetical protein
MAFSRHHLIKEELIKVHLGLNLNLHGKSFGKNIFTGGFVENSFIEI